VSEGLRFADLPEVVKVHELILATR
jgi:hypothetical protein